MWRRQKKVNIIKSTVAKSPTNTHIYINIFLPHHDSVGTKILYKLLLRDELEIACCYFRSHGSPTCDLRAD